MQWTWPPPDPQVSLACSRLVEESTAFPIVHLLFDIRVVEFNEAERVMARNKPEESLIGCVMDLAFQIHGRKKSDTRLLCVAALLDALALNSLNVDQITKAVVAFCKTQKKLHIPPKASRIVLIGNDDPEYPEEFEAAVTLAIRVREIKEDNVPEGVKPFKLLSEETRSHLYLYDPNHLLTEATVREVSVPLVKLVQQGVTKI